MTLDEIRQMAVALRQRMKSVVVGQDEAVSLLIMALLTEGHVLLEGLPGVAKTLMARSFASVLSLDFKRIQFTPDLMPGDVLGTSLFDFNSGRFTLTRGPIFTQILLADEINRTPPKTQSALLEAMQERSVTLEGQSHSLGDGFMVIATQNPIEQEGTYPLPEAQLDRFLFKVQVGYPSREDEFTLVMLHGNTAGQVNVGARITEPVATLEHVRAARRTIRALQLSQPMVGYVVDVVRATREHPALLAGASPRAATMLATAVRTLAALEGRDYGIPDDVKQLAVPALAHRLVLRPGAEMEGMTAETVIRQILERVPAPR